MKIVVDTFMKGPPKKNAAKRTRQHAEYVQRRVRFDNEQVLKHGQCRVYYIYHVSLRLNPTTGFNPIVGCTSNYWMQKHPLVGCSNLCKAKADSRSHWEVAPYAQPILQTTNK